MLETLKFGEGNWANKTDSTLAYSDQYGNFKAIPFDFTRSTTATRVNKQGLIESVNEGIARIDYSDSTQGALLLEPQRTNVVTYSEDFSQWSKQDITVVPNVANSPYGVNNATEIIEGTGTSQHRINISNTLLNSTVYTSSFYVKRNVGSRNFAIINILSGQRTYYNLTNGTIIASYVGSGTIESLGDGWFKCTATGTSISTSGAFYAAMADVTETYVGDGTSSLYIWGCQNEEGSYPTSYIPTNGATATRNQEICNNATPEINSQEGVLYAEISALTDDGTTARRFSLSDGTTNNVVEIGYTNISNEIKSKIKSSGNTVANMNYVVSDILSNVKIALKYKQNDFAVWINGLEVLTDTSGGAPIGLNQLSFDNGFTDQTFFGKTKSLQVFNEALTDAQLQTLTTI